MKAKRQSRREFIFADFTEGEITLMQERATEGGMSLSEWLRRCLIRDVRRIGAPGFTETPDKLAN